MFELSFVFWVHFFSCAFMTGVIWLTQLIHYPAFRYITVPEFKAFHDLHGRALTVIAAPLMVTELATALALCLTGEALFYVNLFLVLSTWGATFFISVPLHNRLAKSCERATIDQLVFTNWYRTVLWSLRSLLLIYVVTHAELFIS